MVRNLHVLGRELAFEVILNYRRSQAYFGQKPEEHGFSIKNAISMEVKNDDFLEKCVTKKRMHFF